MGLTIKKKSKRSQNRSYYPSKYLIHSVFWSNKSPLLLFSNLSIFFYLFISFLSSKQFNIKEKILEAVFQQHKIKLKHLEVVNRQGKYKSR